MEDTERHTRFNCPLCEANLITVKSETFKRCSTSVLGAYETLLGVHLQVVHTLPHQYKTMELSSDVQGIAKDTAPAPTHITASVVPEPLTREEMVNALLLLEWERTVMNSDFIGFIPKGKTEPRIHMSPMDVALNTPIARHLASYGDDVIKFMFDQLNS